MWLLVRAGQPKPPTGNLLVRSPDSPTTDADHHDAWQWAVTGDPRKDLTLETNAAVCEGTLERVHTATRIQRSAGTIVVLTPGDGDWIVTSGSGPWRRQLGPGDVFLAEDDRDERLDVSPLATDASGDSAALNVVRVSPTGGGSPLRWIP